MKESEDTDFLDIFGQLDDPRMIVGGLVHGISVVNLMHMDGQKYYPIDYRIYAKESDGKTKNDYFKEMLINCRQTTQAKKVLFDNWYLLGTQETCQFSRVYLMCQQFCLAMAVTTATFKKYF